MDDIKQRLETSSSNATPSSGNWAKTFVWSTLKSHAGNAVGILLGGIGSTFLGRTKSAISSQQAPIQATVATTALDAVVNTVHGGGTIIDNAVIRNYVSLAANQKLLPFFRTFPSHILTYSAGTVTGWAASELMLNRFGRLIASQCPTLNESAHLQTLERLYDCVKFKESSAVRYNAMNNSLTTYISIVDVRNKRIEYLTSNLTILHKKLDKAYDNSTNLMEKLGACKDQRLSLEKDLEQFRTNLEVCTRTLFMANVRADRRCIVPVENKDIGNTYVSRYQRQNPVQHTTLYDDSFFIKGQCIFGVTTLHIESGDYYHGKALCRTPSDVASLMFLVVGTAVVINLLWKNYCWYTNTNLNTASQMRLIDKLQEELHVLRQRPLLQIQPTRNNAASI
jgi:hypothetical protein